MYFVSSEFFFFNGRGLTANIMLGYVTASSNNTTNDDN